MDLWAAVVFALPFTQTETTDGNVAVGSSRSWHFPWYKNLAALGHDQDDKTKITKKCR